jgi:agmatine deiminase
VKSIKVSVLGKYSSLPESRIKFRTNPLVFARVESKVVVVMPTRTPAQKGYSLPAEWEPHEATWISWPHPGGASFPGAYEKVIPTFVQMVKALAESEIVRINMADAAEESRVKILLKDVPPERLEFFHIPTNEPWCRDHGPIFLTRKDKPRLAAVDFGFNAWGFKLTPFDADNDAAAKIAKAVNVPLIDCGKFVFEAGSIDGNGQGTILTTESCLLNPNRNPKLSRQDIEKKLRDVLGVRQIIWLGDGIAGDDTDGHVDDITRFVNRDTVVTVIEEDEEDANYEALQQNAERLHSTQLSDGYPLRVLKLPMPSAIRRHGQRLPASYANFYIANSVVLLPTYQDTGDVWAESVLKEAFPGRRIVPIDCRELIWGLGAFHCLTQQQPALN